MTPTFTYKELEYIKMNKQTHKPQITRDCPEHIKVELEKKIKNEWYDDFEEIPDSLVADE